MRSPNLGNFLRTLATPEPIKDWSLTSLKDKLIKQSLIRRGRHTENGSVVSSSASLNTNRILVANFTANSVSYTVSLSASRNARGTVSGGGTFTAGSSRTSTVSPEDSFPRRDRQRNASQTMSSICQAVLGIVFIPPFASRTNAGYVSPARAACPTSAV